MREIRAVLKLDSWTEDIVGLMREPLQVEELRVDVVCSHGIDVGVREPLARLDDGAKLCLRGKLVLKRVASKSLEHVEPPQSLLPLAEGKSREDPR